MTGLARTLVSAVAVAGLLSGLVATPAFADRGRHKDWKKHGRHHRHYDRGWDRRHHRSHPRQSDRYYSYGYGPRTYYYGPPGVYVHPAPPSFGLNLVFPIR